MDENLAFLQKHVEEADFSLLFELKKEMRDHILQIQFIQLCIELGQVEHDAVVLGIMLAKQAPA